MRETSDGSYSSLFGNIKIYVKFYLRKPDSNIIYDKENKLLFFE